MVKRFYHLFSIDISQFNAVGENGINFHKMRRTHAAHWLKIAVPVNIRLIVVALSPIAISLVE